MPPAERPTAFEMISGRPATTGMGAYRSQGDVFDELSSAPRKIDRESVKPPCCCIGRGYNKTLLHPPIFMSPESTLMMEGSNGKSRFEAANKGRHAYQACRQR